MSFFFFFNDTATTEIYTLSLHDALPISRVTFTVVATHAALVNVKLSAIVIGSPLVLFQGTMDGVREIARSEEHTSELQSQSNLVCRLLLEKKKNKLHYQSLCCTDMITPP